MRPMTRRTGAAPVGITCALCTVMSIDVLTKQIPARERAAALRLQGLDHGYNLDYPEASDAFEAAIALEPDEPTNQRLAAATLWMRLLFEQGAVTVEDYLGQARSNVPRRPPSASLAAAFQHHLDRATALAEQRLRDHRNDAEAHFQLGAVAALRASYVATVEGRVRDSVGAARRAYKSHERALTLDPQRPDAAFTVGLYRYGIASLPLALRLIARMAGFDSGRETGIGLVEQAARHASHVQTNALFTLVLIYNRERRHGEALRIVQHLQQRYPRNRLLWLEAAGTALRAGRHRDALVAVDEGLAKLAADPRPRAYGEDARWQRQREAVVKAMGGPSTGGHQ
jgi:tetratricopeptide (TPR) repeat protein